MVAARPTRTAPICSSARLVLRVMPGVGRRCVHRVIVDVEAVPSTNNARFARRCTGPRLKDGRAGLKDKLGELRHFMGGLGNLAPDKKALRYGMGVKTVGHDKRLGVDIEAPFTVWHPQHVEITANEAMEAATGKTAKREAKEFLLNRLEAGPVKYDDIVEEAKQQGITMATLRRAKKGLGVKAWKERGKVDGSWFWELPKMANAPPRERD